MNDRTSEDHVTATDTGGTVTTTPNPADQMVDRYLEQLRDATADLPGSARAELLDHIDAHLAETVHPGDDEVAVRRTLDELGPPEEVADAARAESGTRPPPGDRPSDSAALLYDAGTVAVVLLGGFVVPVVGWLAGAVLLWAGPRWNRAEKIVGTLVWPVSASVLLVAWNDAAVTPEGDGRVFLALAAGVLLGAVLIAVSLLRSAARGRVRT